MFKDKWHRHTVAVPKVTRTVDSYFKGKRIERQEMVHQHDIYREIDKEGKVLDTLWHRGARVGVV